MMKINKHIEIVRSSQAGLSSMSQPSCDAIATVLLKHYRAVGFSIINDMSDLKALVDRKPDLVFLGMKFLPVHPSLGGRDTERVWIAEYLDAHHIAYTGSSKDAHQLESNKPLAKQRVLDAGMTTAPFYVVKQKNPLENFSEQLSFPVFIKPTDRGGGLGIDSYSLARNSQEAVSKVHSIVYGLSSDVLVEEYLPGREFSVAILRDNFSSEYSVLPIELVTEPDTRGARILSSEVKSSNTEKALPIIEQGVRNQVCDLAISVFQTLAGRDYGRIDIRLDRFGTPNFLEANLLPSLISGYGSFPKACVLNLGLGYEQMIMSIVKLGLARRKEVAKPAPETVLEDIFVLPSLKTEFSPL